MLESKIQAQIIKELKAAGWTACKVIQCNLNGFPDIIAMRDQAAVFIEVKQPGQLPTALQQYRHKELREQGFPVIVATSTQDIIHLL